MEKQNSYGQNISITHREIDLLSLESKKFIKKSSLLKDLKHKGSLTIDLFKKSQR